MGYIKRKHNVLHKLVQERDPMSGETIYLGLISQKKPNYGGSKNRILIHDSDTKKWLFFTKSKEY